MDKQAETTENHYKNAQINSSEIIKSPRIAIREDKVNLPNGKDKIYHIVLHPGACAILPIDSDGKIIFVRQYRHAVEEILLEIPAGIIDHGENPLTCARRELREETGYNCKEIKPMINIFTTPGFTNEQLYLYIAKGLYPDPLIAEDSDEIDVIKYTLEESLQMVMSGKIADAKTVVAILYYKGLI
ncbi:MAG: NUDIX hydrolase [Rhabdochlamydiaceae bacterium]|nr:NUDIX hydrolase [Candidatus Amphrikana amoebophyrae]